MGHTRLSPPAWVDDCVEAYFDHFDRPPDAVELLIWREVVS